MKNLAYQEETWDELLDGKLIAMSPRPVVNHDVVSGNILYIFKSFLKGKKCTAFGEVDVYLTERDRVVPDAMIVCTRDIVKTDGVYGTPDLIVEVLSPSTAKNDKGYKKNLYEKCGVKEYWIVDTKNLSIEVNLLKDGRLELDEIYSIPPDYLVKKMTDEERSLIVREFKTSLYSDMSIVIEEVFEGMF